MGKSSTYIYNAGESDQLRLQLLNKIYNPNSFLRLREVLAGRKVIVDMGCGQGDIACWLSKAADKDALIIAIDVDSEQLNIAQNKAKQIGAKNIVFIECPAQNFTMKTLEAYGLYEADLIFCRWLLIHLTNEEVNTVLSNMKGILSSDGVLINEEVDLSISYIQNEPASYVQYKKLFGQLASKMGIDFNLGSDLPARLEKNKLEILRQTTSDPIFKSDDIKFFIIDLKSSIELFSKYKIASLNDVEALCDQLSMLNPQQIQKIRMTNILTVSSI